MYYVYNIINIRSLTNKGRKVIDITNQGNLRYQVMKTRNRLVYPLDITEPSGGSSLYRREETWLTDRQGSVHEELGSSFEITL